MTDSSLHDQLTSQPAPGPDDGSAPDRELLRWGGVAGLGGVALMLATVAVVTALGLPDASDVETLVDFADIESGRIAEHLLYLGALVMFALHVTVLHRLLRPAHPAAALFGTVTALFGYVILAASAMLHVSTAPLAELYTDAGPDELQPIESAWHAAQSVFDTMLATGLLLVPAGIVLLGIAMRRAAAFGTQLTTFTLALGAVGVAGAVIEIIDTTTELSALAVLALVLFHLATGWRTLAMGRVPDLDLTDGSAGVTTG